MSRKYKIWIVVGACLVVFCYGALMLMLAFVQNDEKLSFTNGGSSVLRVPRFCKVSSQNFVYANNHVTVSGQANTTARNFIPQLQPLSLKFNEMRLRVTDAPADGEVIIRSDLKLRKFNLKLKTLVGVRSWPQPSATRDTKLLSVSVIMTPDGLRLNDVPCTQNELPSKLSELAAKYSNSLMLNFTLAGEIQYGDFFKVLQQCQIPAFGNFRVSELRR
ncbi:MAG: hypothetical protein LBK71_11465 [Verrucomicrobiales bacterium]|jgi:hypothetical protein|nr:hypothetical protein [Verrucomicrobiales bacterium]